MKKLLLLFVLLISLNSFAQQIYEGSARVAMISDNYASIVFGSRGNAPSTFIIKLSELDESKSKLVEGKKFYFILKRVKFKGTKKTAEVLFHDKDRQQFTLELNDAREKILEKIISL